MKKCDVMIQVDVFNNNKNIDINDKVEFSYQAINEYDYSCEIEILLENMLDENEIEEDKRYIIICDLKTNIEYDWEYGESYEDYLEIKDIYEIYTNIKKYHDGECEESLKNNEINIFE